MRNFGTSGIYFSLLRWARKRVIYLWRMVIVQFHHNRSLFVMSKNYGQEDPMKYHGRINCYLCSHEGLFRSCQYEYEE